MNKESILEKYIPRWNSLCAEEREVHFDAVPLDQIYKMNSEIQELEGRGRDKLSMNDRNYSYNGRHICDYPTLLSLDIPYSLYQADPDNEELESAASAPPVHYNKPPENYRDHFSSAWVRLFYKKKFVYGGLYSARFYISDQISAQLDEFMYEFSDAESIKILRAVYDHWMDLQEELFLRFEKETPATWLIEQQDYSGEPELIMICRNTQTLNMIRPSHIIEDMELMKRNTNDLDAIIRKGFHDLMDVVKKVEL